jgi:orotate phosphoribosyltransferase
VSFRLQEPLKFKSGILSPVYVDNRRLPFHPSQWRVVLHSFRALINNLELPFDVLGGIETAGIPHSAALAYVLEKPSIFIRKTPKEHGTQKLIEGGDVSGKRVLLIEDLVTTGGSCLRGIEALREANAVINDCFAIVSYDFAEANEAFEVAKVRLHVLTTFPVILVQALEMGICSNDDKHNVEDWLNEPSGWGRRHGFGA